jgi:hypothetical protein
MADLERFWRTIPLGPLGVKTFALHKADAFDIVVGI